MRRVIQDLSKLGTFPESINSNVEQVERYEKLIGQIVPPVTDEESRELIKLFGQDDYFGLAWTLVHLIESSPSWPLLDLLENDNNQWVSLLKTRADNSTN